MTTLSQEQIAYKIGDVFQINEKHGRHGWIGAFVLATEIKGFGIQGYVHVVHSDNQYGRAYIRLPWDCIDLIGHTNLLPADEVNS